MKTYIVLVSAMLLATPFSARAEGPTGLAVSGVIKPEDLSIPVPFDDTEVGDTSFNACYYACFLASSESTGCDAPGTLTLTQLPALPFAATNFRVGTAGVDCGGRPVTLPVNLNAGEWLLVDFSFSPTTSGAFADALIYDATPTGGTSGELLEYDLMGNGVSAANVIVAQLPSGMLQRQNTSGGTDSYTLTNTGRASTTVQLTQNGNFFHQTPTSFTLAAGASQQVTLTGVSEPAGEFTGTSIPSGNGVASGLTIPVSLLSAAPPTGSVSAVPEVTRSEVSGPPTQSLSGGLGFTNNGSSTLQGILSSDSAWLIPESGIITINPGSDADVTYSIDNSKRPDGGDPDVPPLGSVAGKMTLSFLTNSLTKDLLPEAGSGSTSNSSVVVVAVSVPTVSPTPLSAIPPNTSAFFIPGVTTGSGSLVDLFLSNIASTPTAQGVSQLSYTTAAAAPSSATSAPIPSLAPSVPIAFANVVSTVFAKSTQTGTLQFRTSALDKIALQSLLLNVSSPLGSFGTAMPVFRNTDGVGSGVKIFLTGLANDAATTTDLFIQETTGSPATVRVDFYNSAGAIVSSQNPVTVPAFGVTSLLNSVPSNAVAAAVTNGATGAGKVVAMAIRHDVGSGDPSAIASVTSSTPLVVPLIVTDSASSSPTRTELALMNTGSTAMTATLTFSTAERRHPVNRSGSMKGSTALQTESTKSIPVTLAPLQTKVISDVGALVGVAGATALTVTPSTGKIAVASRIVNSATGRTGTWGSNVSAIPAASAMRSGETRAITGLGDSTAATIQAAKPVTYRTHFGFVETAGASAVVHVTGHFSFAAGAAQAQGVVSKDFTVGPNEFVLEQDMLKALTSSVRDTSIGDLTDVEIDFKITSGSGAILPFTWSTDNGSRDMIVRVP